MNSNLELHRKLELCLRLGNHLEDILNQHPDDYVLPGLSGFPEAILLQFVVGGAVLEKYL